VPHGRETPDYGPPWPSTDEYAMRLDPALTEWALSSAGALEDSACVRAARANYTELAARRPPAVRYGDSASGEIYWSGRRATEWARNATRYWTAGQGVFGATQNEDYAFATAHAALGRAGRVNATRLVVLRGASDYTHEPAGANFSQWFFGSLKCADDAFASLLAAGRPLLEDVLAGRAP